MNEKHNEAAGKEIGQERRAGFQTQQFRRGGFTAALCAVALAIVVAANLLVGTLPTSLVKPDISQQGFYTLSEQSKTLVKQLQEPVTIYLLAETNGEDPALTELLDRYAALSSQLTVKYVDPVKQPYFHQSYTSGSLSLNSIIVEGPKRSKVLENTTALYVANYVPNYTTGSYDTETVFEGENAVTSAIDYVISDTLPVIYNLTGHSEVNLPQYVLDGISSENIELRDVDLRTLSAVPEDADCVLIASPSGDISADDLRMLLEYTERGGKILMISDYGDGGPNLAALAENFGLRAVEGIVFEGDASRYVQGLPFYVMPKMEDHRINEPLINANHPLVMPMTQGLHTLPAYRGTLTITPLLTTSESAFAKSLIGVDAESLVMEQEPGDIEGPFYTAILSSEQLLEGETSLLWIGGVYLLDEGMNELVTGANLDFFLNAISFLCDKESSISIHGKSLAIQRLAVPDSSVIIWTVMLAVVLPLVVIGCGLVVWLRRRKRV